MPDRTSNKKILFVALLLSLVCSALVTVTTVSLRPVQEQNKWFFKQRHILKVAGIWQSDTPVNLQGTRLEPHLVDFSIDWLSDEGDPVHYDQYKVTKDVNKSDALSREQDIARIGRLSHYAPIYFVRDQHQHIQTIILPIHGYGLWSTLFGFIALDANTSTIVGLTFYEGGDTPGLGGEVENPKWLAKWKGKELFDQYGNPAIRLVKGHVDQSDPNSSHQVDAISGATLTSRGVENIIRFWMGEEGFGPFLDNFRLLGDEI